jgi:class 3 adenylate cyclase/ligand-binding sensor domain-containing protein
VACSTLPVFGQAPFYRHYDVNDGLSSATVYDILQSSDGFIWFGSEAGVSRFDGLSFESFSKDDGLADNEVFGLYEDPWERIWFFPFNGSLSYYDSAGFHQVDPKTRIKGYFTNTLALDDAVFLGTTDKAMIILLPDRVQKIDINQRSTELLRVKEDSLFYTDWKKEYYMRFRLSGDSISIVESGSTERAIESKPGIKITSFSNASDSVVDHEGNTWFSTLGNGVYMKSSEPVLYLNSELGMHYDHVYSMSVNDEVLVVGYQDGSIDIVEPSRIIHRQFTEQSYNRVLSSVVTGQLWLATDRGLIISGTEDGAVEQELRAIKCLAKRKNDLLVGTYNGLYTFDMATHHSKKLFDQRTISVFPTTGDSIWIGTNDGLWLYQNNEASPVRFTKELNGRIKGITQIRPGLYAFGTHGEGVIIKNDDEVFVIDEENGLANDLCQSLCSDGRGTLWLGTNNGLYRLKFSDDWKNPGIDFFNEENGLLSNYVEDLKYHKGKLYVGTNLGISIFPVEDGKGNSQVSTYIRSVQVNGTDTTLSPSYTLDHTRNNIRIEFSAIAFESGHNTKFRHRLKGVDNHWITTSFQQVHYEALPPGRYRFEVRAVSSKGEADPNVVGISFTIEPPFWKSTWFRVLLFTCIGGILVLGARAIFKYNHRKDLADKNKALEEKNQIIAESKKRSEELLLNILPESVASELMERGEVMAKNHSEVAVFFSDFKGFTNIAEHMTPEELVSELDYCFRAFDSIMVKYRIEKLKTIGDAYMCATGLTEMNTNKLEDMVDAAIEVREFMEQYKADREQNDAPYFEIRIGLHIGHVVSGVVGLKKFAYDIWGDTVNIAARMESSGGVGKINTSKAVFERVNNRFNFESRGLVSAKNKGEMEMFYLLNRKQNVQPS